MLEPFIKEYIERLISAQPEISSVWLMGSRANGTQRFDSDWDLLVFGTQVILDALINSQSLHNESVDLMVVYNGDDFKSAWGKKQKSGDLTGWHWNALTDKEATYKGTKGIIDKNGIEEFNVKVTECNAYRVYP